MAELSTAGVTRVRRNTRRDLAIAGSGLLAGAVCAGLFLTAPSQAVADGTQRGHEYPVPPVIAVESSGVAIIGDADGFYYRIDREGRAERIVGNRRRELRWR